MTDAAETATGFGDGMDIVNAIFSATTDVVAVKGLNGRYALVNDRCARVMGRPREQIVGRTDAELFAAPVAAVIMEVDRRVMTTGTTETVEEVVPDAEANGERRAWTSVKAALRDDRGQVVGVVIVARDETERTRAASDKDFLLAFGARLQQPLEADALLADAQEMLARRLQARRCTLIEVTKEEGVSRVRHDHIDGASEESRLAPGQVLRDRPRALLDEHRAGRSVMVNDTVTDERTAAIYATIYAPMEIRSIISVPLMRDGAMVAALSVTDSKPRSWSEADVELLKWAAERLWPALEAARALELERKARSRAEQLQQLMASLAETLTPLETAEVILRNAVSLSSAKAGVIFSWNAEQRSLDLVSAVDYPHAQLDRWKSISIDAHVPVAEAARTRRPVVVPSEADYAERYGAKGLVRAREDTKSWTTIPLIVSGTLMGVMGLSFVQESAVGPTELALMVAVSQQCAQAWDRARLHVAEAQALAAAEEASAAKTQFLANMSHELRTPLNAISGHVQLLEMGIHGPVTPEQRDALARVQRAQHHLLTLINDVLSVTKMEVGSERMTMANVSIAEVIADVSAMLEPQMLAKGLHYSADIPAQLAPVRADRARLMQVMINLVANALKFTPTVRPDGQRGAVHLSARVTPEDAESIEIRVSDNGIGIATNQQSRIFEPFVQLHAGLTRAHDGTGLGLAISRELARRMGGDIIVESSEGIGSTFVVRLRRAV